jgi:lysophospholipase L1-like esterase
MGASEIARLQSARDAMHSLCAELTLRCYDLYDVFQERAQRGEALYYVDDMHLNPYGNVVLAEALAVWLREDGIIAADG